MSVLVDTNVLLRSVQPSHPMHDPAVRAVAALIRGGEPVVITPQIVAEFWECGDASGEQQRTRLVPPTSP